MTAPASAAPPAEAPAQPITLADSLWTLSRRDELVHALARAAGINRPGLPARFQLQHPDLASGLAARAVRSLPALFRVDDSVVDGSAVAGLLALVSATETTALVLAPDGSLSAHARDDVAAFLRADAEGRVLPGLGRIVTGVGLPAARTAAIRGALMAAALAGEPVVEAWSVRPATGSLFSALRDAGLARRLALTALAYAVQLVLLVVAWWMVGQRAVEGHAATAGVLAWLAVLGALVGARLTASWAAGRLAIDGGRLLRTHLMEGLLALDTEPLRAEGIGQLLGRVMETEAVESLALGGGLLALAGLFELTTGGIVLALGVAGPRHLAILSVWLLAAALLGFRLYRLMRRWSALRLGLTHDLVERMVGHRTLVAQQPPALRHGDEDQALKAYLRLGQTLDRTAAVLAVLVPRGWLLLGIAALAPALSSALRQPADVAGLMAISLGGVLFVFGALRKLSQAFPSLGAAAVAWRQVAPLFAGAGAAAALPGRSRSIPAHGQALADEVSSPPIIAVRDVGFRYPGRLEPALRGCSLEIRRGDRILLEGPSGGGKSTLGALIAGLRPPDVGVMTLDGNDQTTMGLPRWRARVGVVPQFHENHVFSASVLFNLMVGRGWPPRREDVAEAEAICRELDLSGVLARMPSGLEQLVGESGWQLSHGEKSRLFIARALLQRLDVRVLDESFAALDPETLERVLDCVLRRSETLVVIAHP